MAEPYVGRTPLRAFDRAIYSENFFVEQIGATSAIHYCGWDVAETCVWEFRVAGAVSGRRKPRRLTEGVRIRPWLACRWGWDLGPSEGEEIAVRLAPRCRHQLRTAGHCRAALRRQNATTLLRQSQTHKSASIARTETPALIMNRRQ